MLTGSDHPREGVVGEESTCAGELAPIAFGCATLYGSMSWLDLSWSLPALRYICLLQFTEVAPLMHWVGEGHHTPLGKGRGVVPPTSHNGVPDDHHL